MIEAIKSKLWDVLRSKEVSLAMVYDRDGEILWSRGRTVTGRNIDDGTGFPKSLIRESLSTGNEIGSDDVVVTADSAEVPESARVLYLKSLLIRPLHAGFFLYVDSGSKQSFSEADREVFRALGELLGDTLAAVASGNTSGDLAGSSPAMARVRELVARYSVEEEPVLLSGETGVGKTHVASQIHRVSGRAGRLLVVHCPSVAEGLFESEMFGHRRGSFTGAVESRKGLVQAAAGGTLLLDEVSEIPLTFQAKLLSFVETRRYRAIGETTERKADIRLLAASNRDLAADAAAGSFRTDLYYRLNVLPVAIPPLRERPGDVRDLVEHHMALLRGKHPGPGFFDALERHPWPGNVRELVQVLKRTGIELPGPEIGSEVASLLMPDATASGPDDASRVERLEAELRNGASFWDTAWKDFLGRDLNRRQLRRLLGRGYRENGSSLRDLARAFNIDHDAYPRFVSALHKYDVHPGRD
jgi:transcriptional regulator with AAA-type ATPase domain